MIIISSRIVGIARARASAYRVLSTHFVGCAFGFNKISIKRAIAAFHPPLPHSKEQSSRAEQTRRRPQQRRAQQHRRRELHRSIRSHSRSGAHSHSRSSVQTIESLLNRSVSQSVESAGQSVSYSRLRAPPPAAARLVVRLSPQRTSTITVQSEGMGGENRAIRRAACSVQGPV
jgi:hypothetical protein